MSYGKTFQLDDTGDLVITNMKRIGIVEETDKVIQDLKVILLTVVGSYPFNTEFGVDYPAIISDNRDETAALRIRAAVASYKYVEDVADIVMTREGRRCNATVTAVLVDGSTIMFGVIY